MNENPKPKDLDRPEPDEQLIEELVGMGFSRHGAYRSVEACKNAGVQEALEYAFQHSSDSNFNDPPPSLQQDDSKKKKKKPRLIPLELQHLFTRMQCLDCATISTQDLTSKGFQWQGMDGRVQHDAHELNRWEPSSVPPLVCSHKLCQVTHRCSREIFEEFDSNGWEFVSRSVSRLTSLLPVISTWLGTLGNLTQCLRCHNVTEREEKYYDLLLQVINCEDLAKSFRSYLAPELLDGCNSYACDICGTKQSAHRRVAIHSVPSLLTISCQRFDIDRKTWERVKVTSKNEFPLALVRDTPLLCS